MDKELIQEFWTFVVKGKSPDDCWSWLGNLDGQGYARLKFKGKHYGAHRISYFIHYGETNLLVLHTCDCTFCTNPLHLFEGDDKLNAEDRNKKGRQAKGEKHGRAKIKEEDVLFIRTSNLNDIDLGNMFGIKCETVKAIRIRKIWKWL